MEIRDWITIISVVVVMAGWFINGRLNRLNEIAKLRLDYRLSALESVLKVWDFIEKNSAPFTDSEFLPLLEQARRKIHLYGYEDEIRNLEAFIGNCSQQLLQEANTSLQTTIKLVQTRIRTELKIKL